MKFLHRTTFLKVLLITCFVPSAPRVFAKGGMPLWTNILTRVPWGSEAGTEVVVDNSGTVFVTAPSAAANAFAIIAYSSAGVPLWTNYSHGLHLAVDTSGNLFVAGSAWNGSNYDFETVKYSGAGIPLWTNYYNGPANQTAAHAIATDRSGNVIVAGSSDAGSATVKYSNAGVPLWTNRYGGYLADTSRLIAVDSNGNVLVAGSWYNGNNNDYATVSYSAAGVPLWTNRYNGPNNDWDRAQAIAVDSTGNVFVTGYSRTDSNRGSSSSDYATVAYSNSGALRWVRRYDGPVNQGDEASAITVDDNGNVFVTGSSVTVRDFISDPPDFATIKYSNSGVPLWTNRYNGPGNNSDLPTAMALDAVGNVFVTGESSTDYATVAYSDTGEPLWENRYNGPDNLLGEAQAIAVDGAGNVFVTGYSRSSDGFSYYTIIKYSSSLPPLIHLDFQKLNNHLVLSWTNAGFNLQFAPTAAKPSLTFRAQQALTQIP